MSIYRIFGNIFSRVQSVPSYLGHGYYIPQEFQKSWLHISCVDSAARKGTREKARLRKIKKEVQKVSFVPHNERKKRLIRSKHDKHLENTGLKPPIDDVYYIPFFVRKRWPIEEAIEVFKEVHHPTMFNKPDTLIYAFVELNMEGEKKTRFLDAHTKISLIPNGFPDGKPRRVLAFCKEAEMQKEATDMGAEVCGGAELIKSIQNSETNPQEFDYIIAHPNILTELVPIRGLLKKKFPNIISGTLDVNIPGLVKRFCAGIQFKPVKDAFQQNYAEINTAFGRLNMETSMLTENFVQLLKDINKGRPKRSGLYVTRCHIISPPSNEKLRINPFDYIPSGLESDKPINEAVDEEDKQESDSDDEQEKQNVSSNV